MDYKEIAFICEKYNIKNWSIDNNGLVDVEGDVYLNLKNLTEIPLSFGKVSGEFFCSINKLKTLKGSPYYVSGNFACHGNQLTSLEFLPDYINGNVYSNNNKLYDVYDFNNKFIMDNNPVYSIYKYITKDEELIVSIDYFKDCKILIDKDIYIERFKAFLDSYGLNSDINVYELIRTGYIIK